MLFKLQSLSIQKMPVEFLDNRIKVFVCAGLTPVHGFWDPAFDYMIM